MHFRSPEALLLLLLLPTLPQTPDGRVVFMLPFQNHVIAGTTDTACEVRGLLFPSRSCCVLIPGLLRRRAGSQALRPPHRSHD